ncbi:MAG: bifunctional adenosylcobinamide kinase/adenosylcobinamide-phosphate guanylyltransferase [Cyanobacteria bacterium TGS_CYA1]|nr:bifunctional adenosylcobinamide kinase/adenosylcobinamide-phosphate guanylyltransferase [Cyanobacteria bacterium TGS_CYA1]
MELTNLILVTGGASSGKSTFAEKLAREANLAVTYVATMPRLAGDSELSQKIEAHKQRRPSDWSTVETTCEIGACMQKLPEGPSVVVLDCLSAYVSNLIIEKDKDKDEIVDEAKNAFGIMASRDDLQFLIVTNEVGSGIIPEHSMARKYREALGRVNQLAASLASQVFLCVSGIPVKIK